MKKQKPFFAKFLENQFSVEEAKNVKGGEPIAVTLKYPSDAEDGADTGPGNACDTPAAAHNPNCPPIFVTLKFPSDSEDAIV
jgi:hypothetical protein